MDEQPGTERNESDIERRRRLMNEQNAALWRMSQTLLGVIGLMLLVAWLLWG